MCAGIRSRCSSSVSGVASSGCSKRSSTVLVPEKSRVCGAHDLIKALFGVLTRHRLVFQQHRVLDGPTAPTREKPSAFAYHRFERLLRDQGINESAIKRLGDAPQS